MMMPAAAIAMIVPTITIAMIMSAIAIAMIVTASASACFATEYFNHVTNLIFRRIAVFNDMTFEIQRFAC